MRNMTHRLIVVLISVAAVLPAWGQTAQERAARIMADPSYVFGEGWGKTNAEADNQALANLVSKVSVSLNSAFSINEKEMNSNGGLDAKSMVSSVVSTYSRATLTNTSSLLLENEPKAHVLRFITKTELTKIFDQRKDKVLDYIRSANRSEQEGKIDNALRYYYWALILLKSLQYPNTVTYDDSQGRHLLSTWIPQQLDNIFDNLNVSLAAKQDNTASLYVTYKGRPITSVDYTYFDGLQWSNIYSAKDGMGVVDLRPGADTNNIPIKFEYEYTGQTHIDGDMEGVMPVFNTVTFRKAQKNIGAEGKAGKGTSWKQLQNEVKSETALNMTTIKDANPYSQIMAVVIKAIKTRHFDEVTSLFTPDGWTMFSKLLKYGRARLIGNPQFAFYPMGENNVVCRSIPMSFSFVNNKRTFVEDVTFTFNSDRKIEAVAFGLGKEANDDIFNKGVGRWPGQSKMIIANFLENYKTAFALKRLDYIKSIFSDNAVIITGHVVKETAPHLENAKYLENEYIRYNRQTKDQYLKNLQRCFNSNEFINIRFTDNDVVKMGTGGELYGIQIHQDYYSSTYGDTGYLFLLVDINNPKQPVIFVRTWQPNRDPNINNRLPKDDRDYGIFGPGNF